MDEFIVYRTTNLVNGKYYIGVHRKNGRKYLGSGKIMKQAIAKYGRKKFRREVIASFLDEDQAYELEAKLVDDTVINDPMSYNIVLGGGKPPTGSGEENNFFGKKHSKESLDKMSSARKGTYCGKDHWSFENTKLFDKFEEIKQLYLSGRSLNELSKLYNVGIATIWRRLRVDEECQKKMAENNNTKDKRICKEEEIEHMRVLRSEGKSLRSIGRMYGVSHHTVIKYLQNKE